MYLYGHEPRLCRNVDCLYNCMKDCTSVLCGAQKALLLELFLDKDIFRRFFLARGDSRLAWRVPVENCKNFVFKAKTGFSTSNRSASERKSFLIQKVRTDNARSW